jgi:hypothetical protein
MDIDFLKRFMMFKALSRELTCTLQARDSEILRINAELKVQKDHVEDIQMKMKYLKDDLAVAEDKYLSEKQYKIKIGMLQRCSHTFKLKNK